MIFGVKFYPIQVCRFGFEVVVFVQASVDGVIVRIKIRNWKEHIGG